MSDVPATEAGALRVSAVPLRFSPVLFCISLVAALLITGALLVGVLSLAGHAEWWPGFMPATIISIMAAIVSAVPVLIGVRFGVYGAVAGYFISMGLRATVSLACGLIATRAGHAPLQPTLLLMVPFYFALVAVETALVSRALWTANETKA